MTIMPRILEEKTYTGAKKTMKDTIFPVTNMEMLLFFLAPEKYRDVYQSKSDWLAITIYMPSCYILQYNGYIY